MRHIIFSTLFRTGVSNVGTLVLVALLLLAYNAWAAPESLTPIPSDVWRSGKSSIIDTRGNWPADNETTLQEFQLISEEKGWVLTNQRLYWTNTAGRHWRDITPFGMGPSMICAVSFFNTQYGWLVSTHVDESGYITYFLAQTSDGGNAWQITPLSLFEPHDVNSLAGAVYLHFIDSQTGWLVIKQATSSNFSVGALFKTTDGGHTWTRLSIPIGEPVHFVTEEIGWTAGGASGDELYVTSDGGLTWEAKNADEAQTAGASPISLPPGVVEVQMATPQVGWAKYVRGSRVLAGGVGNTTRTAPQDAFHHTLQTGLLKTRDGGQNWMAVPLPSVDNASTPVLSADFPGEPEYTTDSALATVARTRILEGQGFDKCEIATLSQLQNWVANSPYAAVNLYIGGSCRGCPNSALSAAYLFQLSQQGWTFIPTWVGPQAACSGYSSRMSYDPTTAYNEGVSEANAAIDTAANLGLTLADKSGTIIYYDLEGYDTTNSACRNAAKKFISGWSAQLQARGNQAGVYGSACASAINDFAGISHVPNAVWPAHWIYNSYNSNASVWGVACIPDGNWVSHQRIRQYAGGHSETWGGVALTIDCNVIDGIVADISVDGIAPTTSRSLSGASGDNGWYVSNVQVTLSASDNSGGSGVKLIQYRIDSGSWHIYSSPFPVSGDGSHTVYYKSQDNAGNWESEKQVSVRIDTAAPTGSLTINNGATTAPGVLVRVGPSASDATSGVYQLRLRDAGGSWSDWRSFSSRVLWQLPAITGQSHTVEIQFKDRAGNTSATYSRSIYLDVYPARPASAGYRLARSTWGAAPWDKQSAHYRLQGTVGQPSMIGILSSANYRLSSGYWTLGHADHYTIYLPLVVRNN